MTVQTNTLPYQRHLQPMVDEALLDTPVVLVNGPRQCGKTTLVQQYATGANHGLAHEAASARGMPYFSLDDAVLLQAVRSDPQGFARRLDRAIIDEVQRVPELLVALKLVVDEDRRPGRFLLTGSANLMALLQIPDSLAGRIEVLTLLPLSNAELRRKSPDFLLRAQNQDWPNLGTGRRPPKAKKAVSTSKKTKLPDLENLTNLGNLDDIEHQVLAGGYPEMRLRPNLARKQAWARAYLTTLVERDIRDVAQIDQVKQVPQLLRIAAHLSGQMVNLTQIGGQLGLNAKTVDKYISILETLFLVRRLPAWSQHELGRLMKTPKLHFIDAGLQSTLVRLSPDLLLTERTRFGATLETWVHGELQKILSITPEPWYLSHFRDSNKVEVDFVLESPSRQLIGIEVKAAASVGSNDFNGLRKLQQHAGAQFLTGMVLYNGIHALPFGRDLWAIPLSAL